MMLWSIPFAVHTMSNAAIHLQQVIKNYDKKTVLKSINLEIAQGEFFGLVGMNGAGKTTLLKCLLDFCGQHRNLRR